MERKEVEQMREGGEVSVGGREGERDRRDERGERENARERRDRGGSER